MVFKRRVTPLPDYVRWDHRWSTKNKNQLPCQPGTSFDDHALEQLTLFDMPPDPQALRQRLMVEDSELPRSCPAIFHDPPRVGQAVQTRRPVVPPLNVANPVTPPP